MPYKCELKENNECPDCLKNNLCNTQRRLQGKNPIDLRTKKGKLIEKTYMKRILNSDRRY